MLAAVLPAAFDLGVDPVVLVCAETNIGSRRVIERNGGRLTVSRGRCCYQISHHIGRRCARRRARWPPSWACSST
ncbi:hypothetical protein [Actinoallomurus soli]|uniref:hypothetical protein n=1 Tax=Actinoallomurus soli TaxID=2952535 RepID=UPI0038733773